MADQTLAPQGTESPNYNPSAAAGTAGSLDPTINSASLSPATPITPVQPNYPPVTSIAGIDTTAPVMTATPQETQASDLTKSIQALNESLAGKSAFQQEQNVAAGVPDIQNAQRDLTTRITQLKAEATAIPLQLQQEALGRGQTTAGLAPIQTGQLRDNSIKALTLSSLSDALSNNLVSAQAKADQAVAAKYGPLEAEQKAKMANLDLILKDPATTLADKNRANAQKAVLDAQDAKIAQAKLDQADILKTAHDAATNATNFKPSAVSGAYYPTLSSALNGIATAKTPAEATRIQTLTGLLPSTNKTQIIGDATAGYSSITTDANGKVISNTPVKAGTGVKLSATDKTSNALSAFSQAFTAGKKMADGTPTVDSNGYITPVAWKAAIADAPAEGLTRADFIKQFGSMLYTTKDSNGADVIDKGYGLTATEQKLITGAITP